MPKTVGSFPRPRKDKKLPIVLSAKHGLLDLNRKIDPYDCGIMFFHGLIVS